MNALLLLALYLLPAFGFNVASYVLALTVSVVFARSLVACSKIIFGFVFLFIAACFMSIFWDYGTNSDLLKGAYYASRPIAYFFCGFASALMIKKFDDVLKIIAVAAVIASVDYIFSYINVAGWAMDRVEMRRLIGRGYHLWAIFFLIFFYKKIMNIKNEWFWNFSFAIVAIAVVVSDSRTAIITSFFYIFIFCVSRKIKLNYWAIFLYLAIYLLSTPFLWLILGKNFADWVLLGNFFGGFAEIIPIDKISFSEINEGWRGYESFVSYIFVLEQGWFSVVFGTGLTSLVPLGIEIDLGGNPTTEIPIFHNGFSFVFVRFGLAGVAFYLLQIYFLVYFFQKNILSDVGVGSLGCALVFGILITTPVISGAYNPEETGSSLLLTIGVLSAFVRSFDLTQNK